MKFSEESAISAVRLKAPDSAMLREAVRSVQGMEVEEGRLAKLLSSDTNIVVTAISGSRPVGILLAYRLDRISDKRGKLFLYDIEVLGEYRRLGAGRKMIEKLLSIAREESCASVFVLTNSEFEGAPEFYSSTGARLENGEELLFVYDL